MSTVINNPDHPVVLFIPESGIYPFMRGLSVLGSAVVERGGKVLVTHDTGQMLRSPIMAMYQTSIRPSLKDRVKIRLITELINIQIINKYGFSSIELSQLLDKEIFREINSLGFKSGGDLRKINFRGFPAGKITEFDFVLETKFPYSSKPSESHRKLYLQYVKNTALTVAVTDKICELYKPSLLITFNEYAQCQAVRYSAEKHNVRYLMLTYPVHFNIDASRFSLCDSSYAFWRFKHAGKWDNGKDMPILQHDVLASWHDSIFRMYGAGSHIFSSRKRSDPRFVFKELKLNAKRKTIVVYTSSQDERICSDLSMKIWNEDNNTQDSFRNQTEWLLWLKNYASNHSNIQIVVRVHPREGKRLFGFGSSYLKKLKNIFRKNSGNFTVVWPDDPVSSYDLMELADVCLTAWSVMGQEAARVGIPVLSYSSNMFYPDDDFIQTASSRKEYEKRLNAILKMDYKWQHLLKAVRFYHWRTFVPSLDLGKTVPADFDDRTVWPKAPSNMVGVINDVLSGKQDLIKYNLNMWKNTLPKNAAALETKAMKKGIRYFLDKIFYPPVDFGMAFRIYRFAIRKITGNDLWVPPVRFKDYRLKFAGDTSKLERFIDETRRDPNLRVIVADDREAILVHRGKQLKRMSPMVIRLARLYNSV